MLIHVSCRGFVRLNLFSFVDIYLFTLATVATDGLFEDLRRFASKLNSCFLCPVLLTDMRRDPQLWSDARSRAWSLKGKQPTVTELNTRKTDGERAHDENSPSNYPCAPFGHSLLTSLLTQPRNPALDSKILLAWSFKTEQRHESPEEESERGELVRLVSWLTSRFRSFAPEIS